MQPTRYRKYDEAFKRDALQMVARGERSIGQIAYALGMKESTLRYWYNLDVAKKKKRAPGVRSPRPVTPPPEVETLEEQNARLKREVDALQKRVDELEVDRAILKKAAAFFVKESE